MANFTDDSEVRCKSAEAIFALELSPLLSHLRRRCYPSETNSARVSCTCSGATRLFPARAGETAEMANFTDDSEVRCKSAESIFALELSPLLSRLRRRCCEPYSARARYAG